MSTHNQRIGRLLALGGALALAVALPICALAQERPSMAELTCSRAKALVQAEGAVVLSTGPQGYERVVRDVGFCGPDDTTSPDYLASADERQCFVGYRCRPVEHGESKD